MSLIRQLWLAVVVVMTLAFGGTFAVSTVAARHYFEQQLFVKNVDNAAALALSMSQMDKDPVTLELLLSAQFDAGHYRLIRLVDPSGNAIVERRNDRPVAGVPEIFVAAVPLRVAPGVAQVQDGWKQYGTLTLESHDQYAYAELWSVTLRLLGWFTVASLGAGAIGSALLRLILRPLKAVVYQADAMGKRQFITQAEPFTIEFRQLVRSMNALSGRVQQMLHDESQRVEQLRLAAQIDPVTGLLNRETFMATLDHALARDDQGASGVLVILRMAGLADLNRAIGREAVDQLLRRVGERLSNVAARYPGSWTVARLSGADFAVMAPDETDTRTIADTLWSQAQLALDRPDTDKESAIRAGCTPYQRAESRAAVLSRADGALAQAEQSATAVVQADQPATPPELPTDLASWRRVLEDAMQSHGVRLGRYPVTSVDGTILHHESPVRLRIGQDWQPAARFIAWAARLGLMSRLDTMVIEAALAHIAAHKTPVSVNVSPEALCDPGFGAFIARHLGDSPELAAMLWLEVPEFGALRQLPEFRRFCRALKPLGCKLGLKHAGLQFSRVWELHDLGLDYLKLDGSIVHGVRERIGHQAFLRSLCTVAHTIGLTTIAAAGIDDARDLPVLADLGIDGFTGPAVRAKD
ncbi:MAG: bifunctional diguanylate cyclase/phosphodiesterase [Panacagrimonas sp.]